MGTHCFQRGLIFVVVYESLYLSCSFLIAPIPCHTSVLDIRGRDSVAGMGVVAVVGCWSRVRRRVGFGTMWSILRPEGRRGDFEG